MKRVQGLDIPQILEEVCDLERIALVVYDMQVGLLKQIKDPDAIVSLKFTGDAVFTDVETSCGALKRKRG
jgi:hypothetical protein